MPSPIGPATHARRTAPAALALLAAVLVAGCASGPVGSAATAAIPASSGPPGATREPGQPGGTGAEPPSAALASPGGETAQGELGGFTWAGAGSDAPWLVPSPGDAVTSAGPYAVALDPPLPVDGWTARWARVIDGRAGDPVGFADGGASRITFGGPPGPGTWSLQVDARFAGGGRAAWYWRVGPVP